MLSATRISAQPWPTLPDGSLVLTIQGDRVILPAPMLQHPNHVAFYKIPTIAFSAGGTSLKDVRVGSGNLDTGHRWIFGLNAA